MSRGEKLTEKQHYVPRMYLKGFSEVKEKKREGKYFIWQFDLGKMKQMPDLQVNIKKCCYQNNLYELTNKEGSFVLQNFIENTFGIFEDRTTKVIESIQKKALDEKCFNCKGVLSEDDKSMLIIFITALKYRDPQTIENGIRFMQELEKGMDYREARNFTLMNLLPLSENPKWNENTIIRSALSHLSDMAFQIGVAQDDLIITSDRPVIEWNQNEAANEIRPKAVAFPLTSKMVLYLFPKEDVDPVGWNCFFPLNEDQIDDIQTNVAVFARRWIFSRKPLNESQISIVKKARSKLL